MRLGYFFREVCDLLSGRAHKQFDAELARDSLERDARRAVQLTARGNISILSGNFVTPLDLERERAELNTMTFPPPEMRRPKHLWPDQQAREHARAVPIARRFRERFQRDRT
jgi:hypothetical protein